MTRSIQRLVWAGLVAGATGLSLAGPLDQRQLPPEVRLVMHADFDAMRGSDVGRFLIEHPKLGPMPLLERLRRDVGVDPVKDLHGVTMYTTSPCMAHTVAVLTCSSEGAKRFGERMAAGELPDFEHGGQPDMEYWSWRRREMRTFAAIHAGGLDGERRIIFADSVAQLDAAVKQLDAAPTTPREEQPQPRVGSCVFVWIEDFGDCDLWRPQAQVLRHTSSVLIDVGLQAREEGSEEPAQVYGAAMVKADSEESAALMRQVLAGTLAMYQLGVQGEPGGDDATHVLRQVQSEVRGKELHVTWAPDGTRMMAALQAIAEGNTSEKAAEARSAGPGDMVPRGTP
ncbi:MAG: hypothetical protein WC718_06225 [Phycisphaerales bacterium]|jgi:hypothetical protein